jgi:hypothetical protein
MALTLPADTGEPMAAVLVAGPEIERHAFSTLTRQVSLRNTGTNTLWISFDRQVWIDIACGTSWDDRVSIREFWHCTQVGRTPFVVVGVALMDLPSREDPLSRED